MARKFQIVHPSIRPLPHKQSIKTKAPIYANWSKLDTFSSNWTIETPVLALCLRIFRRNASFFRQQKAQDFIALRARRCVVNLEACKNPTRKYLSSLINCDGTKAIVYAAVKQRTRNPINR